MKNLGIFALIGLGLGLLSGLGVNGIYPLIPSWILGLTIGILTMASVYLLGVHGFSGYADFWNISQPAIEKSIRYPEDDQVSQLKVGFKRYSFFELSGRTAYDSNRGDVRKVLEYLIRYYPFTMTYGFKKPESGNPEKVYRFGVQHQSAQCSLKRNFPEIIKEICVEDFVSTLNREGRNLFQGSKHAWGDPGGVVSGSYLMVPFAIDEFQVADPQLIESLSMELGRDIQVVMASHVRAVGGKEATQIKILSAIESFVHPAYVKEGYEECRAKGEEARNLEGYVSVQTYLWFLFKKEVEEPGLLYKRVRSLLEGVVKIRDIGSFQALNGYAATLPWLQRPMVNAKTGNGTCLKKTSAIKVLTQFQSWSGEVTGTPLIYPGASPEYIAKFNPFESNENFNVVIAGTSGSGKSVVLGKMIADHLERGVENDAVVVEFGGSFANLVEVYGGVFIDRESSFSLSPFPSPTVQGEQLKELLKDSYALIFEFILRMPKKPEVEALMREIFIDEYMGLDDQGDVEKSLQSMIDRLGERTSKESVYLEAIKTLREGLINLKSQVRQTSFLGNTSLMETRLTVFDLDRFTEHELHILVGLIRLIIQERMVRLDRVGETFIGYDEAHYYIKAADQGLNVLGVLIQQDLRVSRKHRTAIVIATQCIEDYGGTTIAQNCTHQVILKVRGVPEKEDLPAGFEFSVRDRLAIQAFEPARGQGYSSLYLKTLNDRGIQVGILGLRVEMSLLYLLISDKRAKRVMLEAVKSLRLGSLHELVKILCEESDQLLYPGSEEWVSTMQYLEKGVA